ncbi:helix-turn-helix domain-containing protein [Salegentibacter sp. 24]
MNKTNIRTVLLDKHFSCSRYVYNHFLKERKAQDQAH